MRTPAFESRGLLWRFVLLVVLPTATLVTFGVLAIGSERAVVEQRFESESRARLLSLGGALLATLDEAGRTGPAVSVWDADEDPSSEQLRNVLRSLPPDPEVQLVATGDGDRAGLHAVRADTNSGQSHHWHVVSFDRGRLQDLLNTEARIQFPEDRTLYLIETVPTPPTGPHPVDRLLAELRRVEPRRVSMNLPGRLGAWRLVADLPSGDPVGRALVRNRAIYIVALTLVYGLILVGMIVTLRGMRREARISQLKTDFVSNISHELRTPLTSIRLYADTLRLGRVADEKDRRACVDHIAREAERMSALVERTLAWARIEAGQREYAQDAVDLGQVVTSSVDALVERGLIDRTHVSVDLSPSLPRIRGDAGALGQVLQNLLENAVKYGGDPPALRISSTQTGRRLRLSVTDNGIGIDRREHRRIFERFYRADDRLARRTAGSGLGLSIAQRIVQAHKGRIVVDSAIGRGSTFILDLPALGPESAG